MMNSFWQKTLPIRKRLLKFGRHFLSSTHLLILGLALVWMVFFDRYNLISQYKVRQQIENLHQDKAYYLKSLDEVDYAYDRLFNDPEELERYAREKYFMKRADEDVFVVTEE
jgi:cell division protein FtsB